MNKHYYKKWNIICGGMNDDNKIELMNNLDKLKELDYEKSLINDKISNNLSKIDNQKEQLEIDDIKNIIFDLKQYILNKKNIIYRKKLFKAEL